MAVIGVAGMSGSGKSSLFATYLQKGFTLYDDMNNDWAGNVAKAKADFQAGKDVILSDIMFCCNDWRVRLECGLGTPVQWICFENNPVQCILNVLHRSFIQQNDTGWQNEIRLILTLSIVYIPIGEIRKVLAAGLLGSNPRDKQGQ